jgi:[CysO sulfur-carrier protein]-S-L-cysteine hydrolase
MGVGAGAPPRPDAAVLRIARAAYEAMIAQALEARPYEACGILGGRDGLVSEIFAAENAARYTAISYEIGGKDLLRIFRALDDRDLDLLGIYHSHPFTRAYPSDTDVRLAAYDVPYVIVSVRDEFAPYAKAFAIRDGAVSEVAIDVA